MPNKEMIHLIIGTKAQFIKMVPVMNGLESKGGVSYSVISLGQHGATVRRLAERLQISGFNYQSGDDKDVVSLPGMLSWLWALLINMILRKKHLKKNIFKGDGGVALVHGDTLSTLIGLLMAKRAGLKVAHIESGLRSWNYLHPFPEEVIRVICMRYSDYLFAPSDEAVENLKKMNVKGKVFNTGGNTGIDAVKAVVSGQWSVVGPEPIPRFPDSPIPQPYVLVSIHRFENLYSRKRFKFILNTVDEVSKKFNLVFVMHGPTQTRLRKFRVRSSEFGVSSTIHNPQSAITYLPLQDYPAFLHLIKGAEFVVTDGGSVQEECYCLGKPCLIMRKRTERTDGVGRNAVLGSFDKTVIDAFIRDYDKYKKPALILEKSPSAMLVDEIMKL